MLCHLHHSCAGNNFSLFTRNRSFQIFLLVWQFINLIEHNVHWLTNNTYVEGEASRCSNEMLWHHVRPKCDVGRTFSKFGRTISNEQLLFPALSFSLLSFVLTLKSTSPSSLIYIIVFVSFISNVTISLLVLSFLPLAPFFFLGVAFAFWTTPRQNMAEYILIFFAISLYVPNYMFDFFKMLKMLVESLTSLIIAECILIFFANCVFLIIRATFSKCLRCLLKAFDVWKSSLIIAAVHSPVCLNVLKREMASLPSIFWRTWPMRTEINQLKRFY